MKEKMRTIGYLCPRCRKPVMQQRSRFALAASGAIVQCECGKSELQIDFDGEKFRISVPCGVCGGEHLAECGAESVNIPALGSSILNEVRYVVSQQTETEIREVNILVDSMMTD